jgi:outer membrane protein TolC
MMKQLAQQRDLLAVLAGGFPNQDLTEKFELPNLQLPQELPVSLPSGLVRAARPPNSFPTNCDAKRYTSPTNDW